MAVQKSTTAPIAPATATTRRRTARTRTARSAAGTQQYSMPRGNGADIGAALASDLQALGFLKPNVDLTQVGAAVGLALRGSGIQI